MENVQNEVKKRVKKPSTDKIVMFRTTRDLRDKLVMIAAKNVIDGKRKGKGAGSTFSVNHAVSEIIAETLGVPFKREKDEEPMSKKIGLSFLFPIEICKALEEKAEKEHVSVNETMRRILEIATS